MQNVAGAQRGGERIGAPRLVDPLRPARVPAGSEHCPSHYPPARIPRLCPGRHMACATADTTKPHRLTLGRRAPPPLSRSAPLVCQAVRMPRGLLDALDADLRRQVHQSARRRRFARRQPLFYEGDPSDGMHLVESGWIAVRAAGPLGEDVTLAIVGPGESLGEQSLIHESGPRSASALALTAVETLYVSRAVFDELRDHQPSVDRFLVVLLDDRLQRLNDRLTEVLFVPADQRVLRRLSELAASFPDSEIPVTQHDLASLAGTTRPTVNRALRAAGSAGALKLGRGRIVVLDTGLLERLSRGRSPER